VPHSNPVPLISVFSSTVVHPSYQQHSESAEFRTYIINGGDNYFSYVGDGETGVLSFWVTVSSWKGPGGADPYGVYTKKVEIDWPPAE
jgi:hypothetical protein